MGSFNFCFFTWRSDFGLTGYRMIAEMEELSVRVEFPIFLGHAHCGDLGHNRQFVQLGATNIGLWTERRLHNQSDIVALAPGRSDQF